MVEVLALSNIVLPVLIFIAVYILITFEIVDKSIAVLTGVAILAITHTSGLKEMVTFVDIDTIGLLFGMMIIICVIQRTGLLRIISYKIAKLTKGSPLKILLLFGLTTAVFSAFLDNVTTILIMVPITIELTLGLGLDPRLFIITEVLLSNIGGASTLIGDPPNIMIGSATGITFNQFLTNLGLPILLIIAFSYIYVMIVRKSQLKPVDKDLKKIFSIELLFHKIRSDLHQTTFDTKYITKSIIILILVIVFFMLEQITHIRPAVVAITGGLLLFFITKTKFEEILEKVEWNTLLFFIGLFILVGVLEKVGIIELLAHKLVEVSGSNPYIIILVILWATGIISGFLDNIPLTATMIPVIMTFSNNITLPNNIIWWALSLGTCLGGNVTVVGASANVIAVGMAKKHHHHISFIDFLRLGLPIFLISMIVSSIYLIIRIWAGI